MVGRFDVEEVGCGGEGEGGEVLVVVADKVGEEGVVGGGGGRGHCVWWVFGVVGMTEVVG